MKSETKLLTDSIDLIKKEGKLFRNIKASIGDGSILVPGGDYHIEAGDYVRRSGTADPVEMYEVITPGFHELFHRIPARYQMNVRKLDGKETAEVVDYLNDCWLGAAGDGPDRKTAFRSLYQLMREELMASDLDAAEKEMVEGVLDVVREQAVLDNPARSVVQAMVEALRTAGATERA